MRSLKNALCCKQTLLLTTHAPGKFTHAVNPSAACRRHLPVQGRLFMSENVSAVVLRPSKGVSALDNYVVTTWRVLQTTHGRASCPTPTPPALLRHLPLQGRLFLSENVSAVVLRPSKGEAGADAVHSQGATSAVTLIGSSPNNTPVSAVPARLSRCWMSNENPPFLNSSGRAIPMPRCSIS